MVKIFRSKEVIGIENKKNGENGKCREKNKNMGYEKIVMRKEGKKKRKKW